MGYQSKNGKLNKKQAKGKLEKIVITAKLNDQIMSFFFPFSMFLFKQPQRKD